MSRFGTLGTQFFDNAGDPLVSGLINFYQSGTTTRKTTYSDINQTIPNSNPVVLTAAGRLDRDVYFDGITDATITTSDGTVIEVKTSIGAGTSGAFTDWTVTAVYNSGDIVIGSDGNYYSSITNGNQGNDPTASGSESYWHEMQVPFVWNTNVTYAINDLVQGSDGNLYRAVIANSGNNPVGDDGTNWISAAKTEFNTGDIRIVADPSKYTTPSYLPCDASSYNTTTYALLHAVLGLTQDELQGEPNSTLPAAVGRGVSWSDSNSHFSVAHDSSPYVTNYSRSGDAFTKLANPATLPTGNAQDCEYTVAGDYLAVAHVTTPFVTVYHRSGDTFTKLSNPATLPGSNALGVSWDSTGTYLAVGHSGSPFVTVYKKSGTGASATLTKLTNPATLPSNNVAGVDFDRTDSYIAIAISASPYVEWYSFDSGTDTLTKLTAPTDTPTASVNDVTWSPTDDICVAIGTSEVLAYTRSGSTLTLIENAFDTDAGGNFSSGAFSPDGKYFLLTSTNTPGYQLYRVYNNRFTAIPLRQTTLTDTDNYYGVEWGRNSEYAAIGQSASPYVHITKGLPLLPDVSVDNNGKDFPVIKTGL